MNKTAANAAAARGIDGGAAEEGLVLVGGQIDQVHLVRRCGGDVKELVAIGQLVDLQMFRALVSLARPPHKPAAQRIVS